MKFKMALAIAVAKAMNEAFLSLVCRSFDFSIDDFLLLRGKMTGEVRAFVADRLELPRFEVLAALKELKALYQGMEPLGILYPGHPSFPQEFYHVVEPPVFLSYSGDLNLLLEKKLSIVGTRNPHFRFLEWMENHLAEWMRSSDYLVVSGGAFGIDQKATQLALACGKKSIVILPSGLGAIYPKNIVGWKTSPNVLFLSEYLPHESVHKRHFVVRNRLISALGSFLLVVQAAQKSGSMITARYAIEQGREIATIPDFPGFVESAGNLRMIRDGAQVVYGADDLKMLCERLNF